MTDQSTLDAVLDRIADVAAIAPAKKRAFKEAAFFILCFTEWSAGRSDYSPRDRKMMRAIAKAALALDAALKERTRRVEDALISEGLTRQHERNVKAGPMPSSRSDFSQWLESPRLLAGIAGRAHWHTINRRKQNTRGAPTGFRNKFAYELATGLRDAAKKCGGKLTIDKTVGAGSLLVALELCEPLFPGFHPPSAMTLDRMIKKTSEAPAKARGSNKPKKRGAKINS